MLKSITLLLLLTLAGCHAHRARPLVVLPPALVYLPFTNPDPLTAGEIQDVRSRVGAIQSPPIWFILVCTNDVADPADVRYSAIVYFVPDKQTVIRTPELFIAGTPIIREGRCVFINNLPDAPLSEIETYVQVPDPGLAPNPVLTPTIAELPLLRPDNISDADLIQLTTLARAAYAAHDIDADSPILDILRITPDTYEVQIASATPGQGPAVRIRHLNHYFAVEPAKHEWSSE